MKAPPTWAATRARRMTTMLEVSDMLMRFQGITALDQVVRSRWRSPHHLADRPQRRRQDDDVQLRHRHVPTTSGRVRFRGEDITAMPAHRIARHGIARTFQNLAFVRRPDGAGEPDGPAATCRAAGGLLRGFLADAGGARRAARGSRPAARVRCWLLPGAPEDAPPTLRPRGAVRGRQKQVEFRQARAGRGAPGDAQIEAMAGMSMRREGRRERPRSSARAPSTASAS